MFSAVTTRRVMVLVIYALVVIGGFYFGHYLVGLSEVEVHPANETVAQRLIMASTAVFAIASAIPFVPGAEIGIGMILMLGGRIAPLVYLSMVAALTFSFLVGLLVPARKSAAFFNFLGLSKARDMVETLDRLDPPQRIEYLFSNAPGRVSRLLVRHRYLALMLLINTPGNSLIGGGGGIAFAAGLSGLFAFPRYLATICIAVAPFPALYYLLD